MRRGAPRLHLKQSRYLPLGSTGDPNKTWQIPVCARYQTGKEVKESCVLLANHEGDIGLGDKCPDWVFPNSDAAGYFRFALAPADLAKLRKAGFSSLSTRERVAYGNSLRAAFNRVALPMKDVILAADLLATDPHRNVAQEPMGMIGQAYDWLYDDPLRASVESHARNLFHPVYQKLGWQPAKGDDPDRVQLRSAVISFLALTWARSRRARGGEEARPRVPRLQKGRRDPSRRGRREPRRNRARGGGGGGRPGALGRGARPARQDGGHRASRAAARGAA